MDADEKKRSEKQLHASFGEKFVQAAVQLCRHGSNANHARRRSARSASGSREEAREAGSAKIVCARTLVIACASPNATKTTCWLAWLNCSHAASALVSRPSRVGDRPAHAHTMPAMPFVCICSFQP